MNIEKVITALDEMHGDAERRTKKREAAIRRHNKKTFIQPVNFEIGDFVLVAQKDSSEGPKLQVTWKGPRCVVRSVSDVV